MNAQFTRSLLLVATLALSVTHAIAQVRLTDVTVFDADPSGNWAIMEPISRSADIWETRPGNDYNAWIQSTGGSFLNGPTDAGARPNIVLPLGTTTFQLLGAPGLDFARFGINLLFNDLSTPSISAFGPMLTTLGPHSFAADGAPHTASPLGIVGEPYPGAGTLSFISGNQRITLTDFFWATPSVNGLDLTGQTSIGADGVMDYVGGVTFSVTQVPEPGSSLYVLGLLMCGAAMYCPARKGIKA